MTDIITDYAAIAVGTAQAATTTMLGVARAGVDRAAALGLPSPEGVRSHLAQTLRRGRAAAADLVRLDPVGAVRRLAGPDQP
jgi:hypothetical protein